MIDRLYYYVKDASTAWLMCVSGGQLHRLKNTDGDWYWEAIGNLQSETVSPHLVTFNGKLVIADGSSLLKYYDGEVLANIADSPSYATAVCEISNRLVANSMGAGERDAVYFSGAEDETQWNTTEDAVGVRVGYGDSLDVSAFGVLGTDLLVFKTGSAKRLYRISTSGVPSDWYSQLVGNNGSAENPWCVTQVLNDLAFADDTGIKALSQTQVYGDLAQGILGLKVNPRINGKMPREMRFLPSLGVMAVLIEGTQDILLFHPHNSAWTTWNFGVNVTSICDTGSDVFIADRDGYLYKLTEGNKDELRKGIKTDITGKVKTKLFPMGREGVLRRTRLFYEEITPVTGNISVSGAQDTTETIIADLEPETELMLGEATGALADSNDWLVQPKSGYIDSRCRYRDGAIAFTINITGGRVKINKMLAEIANVGES